MKRMVALLTALVLLCTCAAAEPVADDSLLLLAEQIAQDVDIAAESQALHELFGTPGECLAIIEEWCAGEHRDAACVYRIVLDESMLADIVNIDSMSPMINAHLLSRCAIAMVTGINGAYGAASVAAASVTSVSTGFTGTVEHCIYMLCYDEGADIAVCFYPFDSGTSGAYASFLAGDFELNHLSDWMEPGLTIERIR